MSKNGPNIKFVSNLLEYLHASQFEDAEYEFDIDILIFRI